MSIVRKLKLCGEFGVKVVLSENGEREHYRRMSRTLKHKGIRRLLLSSCRYILKRPELFVKSLMLIYAPKLYYFLRKGRSE